MSDAGQACPLRMTSVVQQQQAHLVLDLACECLRAGRSVRLRVAGTSMLPFIRPNDVLMIAPLGSHIPRPGEVLLFTRPDGAVRAHRFLGWHGQCLRLRGDSHHGPGDHVSASAVLGRVIAIERQTASIRPSRHRALLWARTQPLPLWAGRLKGVFAKRFRAGSDQSVQQERD